MTTRRTPLEALWASVERAPDALAVVDREGGSSYERLLARASGLAVSLRAAGVHPGDRVLLYMSKSRDALAGIYACWLCGCSYVPMDPASPLVTRQRVLRCARARAVLCADGGVPIAPIPHVVACEVLDGLAPRELPPQSDAGTVAAILFTSGSTGDPKGAAITHANLAAFTHWATHAFALTPNDRLLSHAPWQFDLSFFDLFAAAACGGAVVLPGEAELSNPLTLARDVRLAGATIWQSVPAALSLQLAADSVMPDVRHVLFAGERMPRSTLLGLPRLFPRARFHNVYGCTETNDTFMYSVPSDPRTAPDPLPIGRALPGVRSRIVDADGRDVERGKAGELLVAADTVMAGYASSAAAGGLDRSTSFVADAYRTRDLVREGDDGELHFLGRLDALVKVLGQRVVLTEVEQHLAGCEGALEVAVLALPDTQLGTRLLAAVRVACGIDAGSFELRLRRHCADALPRHSIPRTFCIDVQPLPRTTTGKLDRVALRERLATHNHSD